MWLQSVKDNLLHLSENKTDVKIALTEWFYTGLTFDLDAPVEDCQLCGHKGIRYQFEILNSKNDNSLLIGSECITRFSIPAVDKDGNILSKKLTKKKVSADRQKLIIKASKKRMIETLILLGQKDQTIEVDKFIKYFDDRAAFTPKQVALLIWRLKANKINYHAKDFKVTFRRQRERDQIGTLNKAQMQNLLECMTILQKKNLLK